MRYTLTRLMDTLRGLPPESTIQAEGRAEYPTQAAEITNAYYRLRTRGTWNISLPFGMADTLKAEIRSFDQLKD